MKNGPQKPRAESPLHGEAPSTPSRTVQLAAALVDGTTRDRTTRRSRDPRLRRHKLTGRVARTWGKNSFLRLRLVLQPVGKKIHQLVPCPWLHVENREGPKETEGSLRLREEVFLARAFEVSKACQLNQLGSSHHPQVAAGLTPQRIEYPQWDSRGPQNTLQPVMATAPCTLLCLKISDLVCDSPDVDDGFHRRTNQDVTGPAEVRP
jgi:hypothetical protein